jgi:hypothetical protein
MHKGDSQKKNDIDWEELDKVKEKSINASAQGLHLKIIYSIFNEVQYCINCCTMFHFMLW